MNRAWTSIGTTAEAPTQTFSLVAMSWHMQTAIDDANGFLLLCYFWLDSSLSVPFMLILILIVTEKREQRRRRRSKTMPGQLKVVPVVASR